MGPNMSFVTIFDKKNTVFSNIAEGSSVGFESSKGGCLKKWQDITF